MEQGDVSSIPLQTLQHLSLRAICSDSAQLSSGHGSLGTIRCMVLSCNGQRHNPHELPLMSTLPPPPLICLGPECNYEGNYSSIVFPLPLSLLYVCSLQPNYSSVNSSFSQTTSRSEKKKKLSPFLSPPVIHSDLHRDSRCIFIIQTVNQSSGLSLHVCLVRV